MIQLGLRLHYFGNSSMMFQVRDRPISSSATIGGVSMLPNLKRLWRQQSGQGLPEYSLLVVLIVLAVAAGLYAYGQLNASSLGTAAATVNGAMSASGGGKGGSGGGSGSGGQGGAGDQGGGTGDGSGNGQTGGRSHGSGGKHGGGGNQGGD